MRNKIYHPVLIALYPVLALLARNIEEIKLHDGVRSLIVMAVVGMGVFAALSYGLKHQAKAALITSLGLALFFLYGPVYNLVKEVTLFGLMPGRHRLLTLLWALLLLAGLLALWRSRSPLKLPNQFLNLIALFLVLMPCGELTWYCLREWRLDQQSVQAESTTRLSAPANQPLPDIYYIILDAYARQDYLRAEEKLDIGPFLQELQQMGFYVANCSQSNYAQTRLSLASTLNMDYLENLSASFQPGNTSRIGLSQLIHENAVRSDLEALGYTSVAFKTGFKATQWEDAGIYLSPTPVGAMSDRLLGGLTGFEQILLRNSAALAWIGTHTASTQLRSKLNNPNRAHYELIQYNLAQLEALPRRGGGPKLVFVHLVIPHPPYVFDAQGEFINFDQTDKPGYRDQIKFLNQRLPPLLKHLIEDSATPPVIILQGDHGAILSSPNQRMSILNAYYLPGVTPQGLSDDITPVNTFRLVFNSYFNAGLDLLPNQALFSVYSRPYDFMHIQNDYARCR